MDIKELTILVCVLIALFTFAVFCFDVVNKRDHEVKKDLTVFFFMVIFIGVWDFLG